MAVIGETLRQARLRSGIDLGQIAEKTKINLRYLQAIEAGEFGKLPGGVFARMFVKQYADALGLDGASFAEELKSDSSLPQPSPELENIVAARSTFRPSVPGFHGNNDRLRNDRVNSVLSSLIWVVAAVLVCAGAYYGLTHLQKWERDRETAEVHKPQPEKQPKQTSSAPVNAASTPVANPVPSETAPPLATAPGDGALPVPAATTPPATSTPVAATPAPTGPIQLILNATEDVWVSVNADGKSVFAGILPAGTNKAFAATGRAHLNIGNAGGLEVTFNGRKLEPFGPKGQIRNVDITPAGAQVISRTPPAAGSLSDPLR